MQNNAHSLIRLAEQQLAQYNPQLALQTLSEAAKLAPDNYRVYEVLAAAHYENYRQCLKKSLLKLAQENAAISLKLNPQASHTFYLLGMILIARRKPRKARKYMNQAIALNPNASTYYIALGVIDTKLSHFSRKWKKHFIKALELNPQNKTALIRLGELDFFRLGKYKQAEEYAKKALTIDNNYIPALVLMGNIMLRKHKYEEAKFLAKQAMSLNPREYGTLRLICLIESRNSIFLGLFYRIHLLTRSPKNIGMAIIMVIILTFLMINSMGEKQGTNITRLILWLVVLSSYITRRHLNWKIKHHYMKEINLSRKF